MRALLLAVLLTPFLATPVRAECRPYPVTEYSPTGIVGCEVYGTGMASWYNGPDARNDCEYPWTDCEPIRITSLDTGRSVVVQPSQFCDCYTGTPNQRLVDLSPSTLKSLGLWNVRSRGLFPVVVEPATTTSLPDTALPR